MDLIDEIFIVLTVLNLFGYATGIAQCTHDCCNGTTFDPSYQLCCSDVIRYKPCGEAACCGPNAYTREVQVCCNGVISSRSSAWTECCDESVFDSQEEICCNKVVATKSNGTPGCCGTISYDIDTQICCQDHVHDDVSMSCCGHDSFDSKTHQCCGDSVFKIGDQDCCHGQVFSLELQSCCGDDIYTLTSNTSCCGDEIYDLRAHLCCDGKLEANTGGKCGTTTVVEPHGNSLAFLSWLIPILTVFIGLLFLLFFALVKRILGHVSGGQRVEPQRRGGRGLRTAPNSRSVGHQPSSESTLPKVAENRTNWFWYSDAKSIDGVRPRWYSLTD